MKSNIISLQVGKVRSLGDSTGKTFFDKAWESGSFKEAVKSALWLSKSGLDGDEVADKIHHGGEEKALFANSYENYENWRLFLGLESLPLGALSENITVSGLHESTVFLGDIHKIGDAIVQVSQPRKPCWKISKKWKNKKFTNEIYTTGLTGWYYRVLREGYIKSGDTIEVISQDDTKISILEANMAFANPDEQKELLQKISTLPYIAQSYKNSIIGRISGDFSLKYMNLE